MSANESTRRPSNAPLWAMFILVGIGLAAFLWTIRMDLPQPPTIIVATVAPQAQPGSGVITGITLPTRAPASAPQVVPTAYTQANAEATSIAAYNAAIQQAEMTAPALPNASKIVEQPAESQVNADWCRGSHMSRPECQPGNGTKVEK